MATPALSVAQIKEATDALEAAGGNVSRAAAQLGWTRGKLQGRLRAAELNGTMPAPLPTVSAVTRTAHGIGLSEIRERIDAMSYRGATQERAALKREAHPGRRHLIIPDVQAKPGVPLDHLAHVGQYIADKRPDVVICIGDFADMPSLSTYDKGTLGFEGRRYVDDIATAREAMNLLMEPIHRANGYHPQLVMTLGNHEDRIRRAVDSSPEFSGKLTIDDLGYRDAGWDVIPYLTPITIDGIEYAHYFTSGVLGRPVSSAAALLRVRQRSAVMGHVQTVDVAIHPKTQQMGLFVGTCYQHNEQYLGPQGNVCRRQIVMLNEVRDGVSDPMFVSLDFLRKKYA